uniref:Uncharacterized protein n=1 Tax=Anopheles merus TaxID=30066 RepID=A0A182V4V1_ANOME
MTDVSEVFLLVGISAPLQHRPLNDLGMRDQYVRLLVRRDHVQIVQHVLRLALLLLHMRHTFPIATHRLVSHTTVPQMQTEKSVKQIVLHRIEQPSDAQQLVEHLQPLLAQLVALDLAVHGAAQRFHVALVVQDEIDHLLADAGFKLHRVIFFSFPSTVALSPGSSVPVTSTATPPPPPTVLVLVPSPGCGPSASSRFSLDEANLDSAGLLLRCRMTGEADRSTDARRCTWPDLRFSCWRIFTIAHFVWCTVRMMVTIGGGGFAPDPLSSRSMTASASGPSAWCRISTAISNRSSSITGCSEANPRRDQRIGDLALAQVCQQCVHPLRNQHHRPAAHHWHTVAPDDRQLSGRHVRVQQIATLQLGRLQGRPDLQYTGPLSEQIRQQAFRMEVRERHERPRVRGAVVHFTNRVPAHPQVGGNELERRPVLRIADLKRNVLAGVRLQQLLRERIVRRVVLHVVHVPVDDDPAAAVAHVIVDVAAPDQHRFLLHRHRFRRAAAHNSRPPHVVRVLQFALLREPVESVQRVQQRYQVPVPVEVGQQEWFVLLDDHQPDQQLVQQRIGDVVAQDLGHAVLALEDRFVRLGECVHARTDQLLDVGVEQRFRTAQVVRFGRVQVRKEQPLEFVQQIQARGGRLGCGEAIVRFEVRSEHELPEPCLR